MFIAIPDENKPKNVSEYTWEAMNFMKIFNLPEDWTDEQCLAYLNKEAKKKYKRELF